KLILGRGRAKKLPAGEPFLGGWYTEQEIRATVRTIRKSMDWHVGFGFMVKEIADFETAFARYCGTRHAVSVATASIGLDLAMRCLDLKQGDEVICPAVNFKASHLAVLGQGGSLVFCEIDPRTLNLDPRDVERRITRRTRAILPVHMNGLAAPMNALLRIARRYSRAGREPIRVIGDAARACGGGAEGAKIGKKGWMTVFSFHTMKLMTTLGEGGMVTTDSPSVAARLRRIIQWGGDREWGSSYKLTRVQAAVGLVQLRRLDAMIARRVRLARRRSALLAGAPELTLPSAPPGFAHTYYLYTLLVPRAWAGKRRDAVVRVLRERYGVACAICNPPTYQGSAFIRARTPGQRLPLSEEIGARLFCPS
ncbi:MAG: DegT/DnrJ/EryC1/StrS family aminotransferase, partial [bacterium]